MTKTDDGKANNRLFESHNNNKFNLWNGVIFKDFSNWERALVMLYIGTNGLLEINSVWQVVVQELRSLRRSLTHFSTSLLLERDEKNQSHCRGLYRKGWTIIESGGHFTHFKVKFPAPPPTVFRTLSFRNKFFGEESFSHLQVYFIELNLSKLALSDQVSCI